MRKQRATGVGHGESFIDKSPDFVPLLSGVRREKPPLQAGTKKIEQTETRDMHHNEIKPVESTTGNSTKIEVKATDAWCSGCFICMGSEHVTP